MAKRAKYPVPKTIDEAEAFLAKMRENQRALAAIGTEYDSQVGELETAFAVIKLAHDEQVATLRDVAADKARPFQTELEQLSLGLRDFGRENRSALLKKEEKTVKLTNGVLQWVLNPARVSTGNLKHEVIIAAIKKCGRTMRLRFVRIKEELNKEALLEHRPVIEGITYPQDEKFIVQVVTDTPEGKEAFEKIELSA